MNHQEASDRLLQQVDSWDAFRRSVNSLEGKTAKGDAFERLIQIFLELHAELLDPTMPKYEGTLVHRRP